MAAFFHLLLPFYQCYQWQGTIEGKEHQPLAWVKAQNFSTAIHTTHKILKNDLPLVQYIVDHLL